MNHTESSSLHLMHCHGLQCVSAGMIMIYESWCILLWIVISTKFFLSSSSIKWYDWTSAMDLQGLGWVALKPPTSELVLQWICCFCQPLQNWPFRVVFHMRSHTLRLIFCHTLWKPRWKEWTYLLYFTRVLAAGVIPSGWFSAGPKMGLPKESKKLGTPFYHILIY